MVRTINKGSTSKQGLMSFIDQPFHNSLPSDYYMFFVGSGRLP